MGSQAAAWLPCHSLIALLYCVAFNEAAELMHPFINFQGQVLHLVQGDTCVFNYVDNLIAFKGQGLWLWEVLRGSDELAPFLRLEFAERADLSAVNE